MNKPELLPPGAVTPVIDVAGFLTEGEETRIRSTVESLEADTGVKLRVLAQNYPQTPGLAIKDYWVSRRRRVPCKLLRGRARAC